MSVIIMNQLLISFCNVFPRGLALGIYDYEKEQFGWIDSSIVNENIMGVNGMSVNNKKYHIITQIREGGSSGLIVVNNDLKPERSYNLVETIDAHSLISYGNGFLVADTGKNRI